MGWAVVVSAGGLVFGWWGFGVGRVSVLCVPCVYSPEKSVTWSGDLGTDG